MLKLAPQRTELLRRGDGSMLLRSPEPLGAYARSVGEKLAEQARAAGDRVFLSEAAGDGIREVTYGEAFRLARAIGTGLLDRGCGPERPIAILSDNSVDHALLTLGALCAGVPVAPISVAYSLVSQDHEKLKKILHLLEPALVFAEQGTRFRKAIDAAVPAHVEVLVSSAFLQHRPSTAFSSLLATPVPEGSAPIDKALSHVGPDTLAKVLFTSGSTGEPKGVLNTQRMLCSNQQAIAQLWPFLADKPPIFVDWLPWSHTFGGNHNFLMALWHGGRFHVDEGKPAPALIGKTVDNLRRLPPTVYFNVPRGYEALLPFLEGDPAFRDRFFSRLDMLFYAAAALPRPLWDRLTAASIASRGTAIPMLSAWGATETSPLITSVHFAMDRPGVIGLPAPGTDLLLLPVDAPRASDSQDPAAKWELRARGPNVTPGYWKNPDATRAAFDEEGFYRTGDAGRLADPERPEQGLLFEGRIAEDFKLTSGTWVHVGALRLAVIAACAPVVADAVITGHDRAEAAALLFPNADACRKIAPEAPADLALADLLKQPQIREVVRAGLAGLWRSAGSSGRVGRALFLVAPPSIDAGEITDKGYLNQRAVREARAADVLRLHADSDPPDPDVIVVRPTRP